MRSIQWVTPEEMFSNWADLSKEDQIALEEMQYKKQLQLSWGHKGNKLGPAIDEE